MARHPRPWIAALAGCATLLSSLIATGPAHAAASVYVVNNASPESLILLQSSGSYLLPPLPIIEREDSNAFSLGLLPARLTYRIGTTGHQLLVSATPYQAGIPPLATCTIRDQAGLQVPMLSVAGVPTYCAVRGGTVSLEKVQSTTEFTIVNLAYSDLQLRGTPTGAYISAPPTTVEHKSRAEGWSVANIPSEMVLEYWLDPKTVISVRATMSAAGASAVQCSVRDDRGAVVTNPNVLCRAQGTYIGVASERRLAVVHAQGWMIDRALSQNVEFEKLPSQSYRVLDPSKPAVVYAARSWDPAAMPVAVLIQQPYRQAACVVASSACRVEDMVGYTLVYLR